MTSYEFEKVAKNAVINVLRSVQIVRNYIIFNLI